MNCTYEFGVYLTHFCNVDLFRQGIYFFRIRVYVKDKSDSIPDGEPRYALPYRTMTGHINGKDFLLDRKDRESHLGHIDDITQSYCSTAFRVQYQEQRIRLNEGCLFRLDLPYAPKQHVYVDLELVFAELHANDYKAGRIPELSEFNIVDSTTLCMQDCYHGIHAIYPTTFSPSHFCLVHTMVHCELINFKFIAPPFAEPNGPNQSRMTSGSTNSVARTSSSSASSSNSANHATPANSSNSSLPKSPNLHFNQTQHPPTHLYHRQKPHSHSHNNSNKSAVTAAMIGQRSDAAKRDKLMSFGGMAANDGMADETSVVRSSDAFKYSIDSTIQSHATNADAHISPMTSDSDDIHSSDIVQQPMGIGSCLSLPATSKRRTNTESPPNDIVDTSAEPSLKVSESSFSPNVKSAKQQSSLSSASSAMTADRKVGPPRQSADSLPKDHKTSKKSKKKRSGKHSHSSQPTSDNSHKPQPIPGRSSFAECLFFDRIDEPLTEEDWTKANDHHIFYLACLLQTYEKLENLILEYVENYFDGNYIHKLQPDFDELYPAPPVEIPERMQPLSKRNNGDDNSVSSSERSVAPNRERASSVRGLANLDRLPNQRRGLKSWKYADKVAEIRARFTMDEKRDMTGRKICQLIGQDVHQVAAQVFRVWHFFLSLIPYCRKKLSIHLMTNWEEMFVERWGACIFRETLTIRDRTRVVSTSLSEHEMISRKIRQQRTLEQLDTPPLQDCHYMMDPKHRAVIFEQTYNLPHSRNKETVRLDARGNRVPTSRTGGKQAAHKRAKSFIARSTKSAVSKFPRVKKNKKMSRSKSPEPTASAKRGNKKRYSTPALGTEQANSHIKQEMVASASNLLEVVESMPSNRTQSRTVSEQQSPMRYISHSDAGRIPHASDDGESMMPPPAPERMDSLNFEPYKQAQGADTALAMQRPSVGTFQRELLSDNQPLNISANASDSNAAKKKKSSVAIERKKKSNALANDGVGVDSSDDDDSSEDSVEDGSSESTESSDEDDDAVVAAAIKEVEQMQDSALYPIAADEEKTEFPKHSINKPLTSQPTQSQQPRIIQREVRRAKSPRDSPLQSSLLNPTNEMEKVKKAIISGGASEHACVGKHVFVLVHGYQGNSWDMRMFRNHLMVLCPHDMFLMSCANEKDAQTEGDIREMGQRLGKEIHEFIQKNCIKEGKRLCRLSFVTHSLGGIIAREALASEAVKPYLGRCHTFISLAVCHCGYLFGRSRALQAGFWVMRSWKKSLCLSQLSLTDNDTPRQTYMYQLSLKPGLQFFSNVLLVSSPEDRYTPYHSTRIEMHRKTVQDTKWGRIYNDMVRNLLRPLDGVQLTRFDVSFVNRKMNLDSMIGRSAHICFLEQPLYIDMLIHVYKQYFVSTDNDSNRSQNRRHRFFPGH